MTKARARGGRTPMTPREVQVLRLVAEGLTEKEIAGRLEIAESTVGGHKTNINAKLGSSNHVESLRAFGLIPLDPDVVDAKIIQARVRAEVRSLLADIDELRGRVAAMYDQLSAKPASRDVGTEPR